MKKVTIALPDEMIKAVHKLADKMGEKDFWTLAITWRQLIKKGLSYFEKDEGKKKDSSKDKANEEPKNQKNNNTPNPLDEEPSEEDLEKAAKEWDEYLKLLYPEDKK